MSYEFAVLHEQRSVGKAEVVKEGLYYRVTCRYRLPSGEVCRLIIKWPGGWENAGIPVPEGDGFFLTKMIPAKKLPVPDVTVHLIPAGMRPDAPNSSNDRADTEIAEKTAFDQEVSNAEMTATETIAPMLLPVFEDQPFDELDLVEKARSVAVDGQIYITPEDDSELKPESNGTVVGAEDICIDGSFDDSISEPF